MGAQQKKKYMMIMMMGHPERAVCFESQQVFRVLCHKLFACVLVRQNIYPYYYSMEFSAELVPFSDISCSKLHPYSAYVKARG